MDEEVKIPTKDELLKEPQETTQEPQQESAPQLTEVEQRAAQLGWTPKEHWSGDPAAWRPADVWLDRGQMIRDIHQLKSKLEMTERQVAEAFKKGVKLTEQRFKEEIDSLRAMKRAAMEAGDFDKVDRIEDKIDTLKEQRSKEMEAKPPEGSGPPPEYAIFLQRNPWYETNKRLRYMADAIGFEYLETHKNATPADVYFFVEQEMKSQLGNTQKKSPPAPEGGKQNGGRTPSAGSGGSLSGIEAQMSEEDRGIMNTLVKTGVFASKEEYLKEYQKALK